jgi:hypothetical protein
VVGFKIQGCQVGTVTDAQYGNNNNENHYQVPNGIPSLAGKISCLS